MVFLALGLSQGYAQGKTYVHTTSTANLYLTYTLLDHPDLNNNPNAAVLYGHHLGENGGFNNKVTSLLYNTDLNQWGIGYEDQSQMEAGKQFNILIANSGKVFTHTATNANTLLSGTVIDHPYFNESSGAIGLVSHYRNGVFADYNFDTFYNTAGNNRMIRRTGGNMLIGASFRVLDANGSGVSFTDHTTSSATILTDYNMFTRIDDVNLNDNPNIAIISTRYAGYGGSSSAAVNTVFGSHYEGGYWHIYREDGQPMPENVVFDIGYAPLDTTMNTENFTVVDISVYPNPATDKFMIVSEEQVTSVKLTDITGKTVLSVSNPSISEVNISNLAKGIYMTSMTTETGATIVKKIIKN